MTGAKCCTATTWDDPLRPSGCNRPVKWFLSVPGLFAKRALCGIHIRRYRNLPGAVVEAA